MIVHYLLGQMAWHGQSAKLKVSSIGGPVQCKVTYFSIVSDCNDFTPLRKGLLCLTDSFDLCNVFNGSREEMRTWAEQTDFLSPAVFSGTRISQDELISLDLEAFALSLGLMEKGVQVADLQKQKDGPRWSLRQWIQYWRHRRKEPESLSHGVATALEACSHCAGASSPNPSVIAGFNGYLTREISLKGLSGNGGAADDEDSDLEDEADSAEVKDKGPGKSCVRESFFTRSFGLTCLSLSAYHVPSLKASGYQSEDCATSYRKSLSPSLSLPSEVAIPNEFQHFNLLTTLNQTRLVQQHQMHHFISLYPAQSFINFSTSPGGATTWLKVLKGSVTVLLVPPTETNLSLYCSWVDSGARDKGYSFLEGSISGTRKACVPEGSQLMVPGGFITALFVNADSLLVNSHFLASKNLALQFYCWSSEELLKTPQSKRFPSFVQAMWHLASSLIGSVDSTVMDQPTKRPKPSRKKAEAPQNDMSDFIVSDDEVGSESTASPIKKARNGVVPPVARKGELVPQVDGANDDGLREEDATFLFSIHTTSNILSHHNPQANDLGGRSTPSLVPIVSTQGVPSLPLGQASSSSSFPSFSPTTLIDNATVELGKPMVVHAFNNDSGCSGFPVAQSKASNTALVKRKGKDMAPDPTQVVLTALGSSRNRNKAPPSLPSKSPLQPGSLHHSRQLPHSHRVPNPSPTVSGSQSLPVSRPNQVVSITDSSLVLLYRFLNQSLSGQEGPYFSGVPLSIRDPFLLLRTLSYKPSSNVVNVDLSMAQLAPLESLPLSWRSLTLQALVSNAPQGHSPCPSGVDEGAIKHGRMSDRVELGSASRYSEGDEIVSSNDIDDWHPGTSKVEKRASNWQKRLRI